MSKFRIVSFVLTTLFAVQAWAAAIPIHVTSAADSGPGSLRQAIIDGNAVSANNYPSIYIDLGTSDPIQLLSPLTTIAAAHISIHGTQATPAVIDGQSQHGIFYVHSGGAPLVSLEHLTLRDGKRDRGGCFHASDPNGWYLIDDVFFDGCSAEGGSQATGGAIFVHGGLLDIDNARFHANVSVGQNARGGAIYIKGYDSLTTSSTLNIRNSQFDSNGVITTDTTGFAAGGAINVWVVELNVEDSLFFSNEADSSTTGATNNKGGAINAAESSVSVRRSTFRFNSAAIGGAISQKFGLEQNIEAGMVLVNNTFVGNHAEGFGGAVNVSRANTVLRNNSFFANYALAAAGGNNLFANHSTASSVLPVYHIWNNLFTNSLPGSSCVSLLDMTSSGFNIIPGNGCGLENEASNIMSTDVHLQGYLFGSSLPAAPLRFFADSPAVDGGYPAAPHNGMIPRCPQLDGQGNPRYGDGDANGSTRCDIGAFEWQREASLFANDFEDRLEPNR